MLAEIDGRDKIGSDEDDGGFVEEENQGIKGKMFVNQHMIKICFKESESKLRPPLIFLALSLCM